MLRAIQGDSTTNVIATPSAVTMDNQEAELKVAQEVPFITGSYASTGNNGGNNGNVNPFTTVQREEVGTILKITPQINEGGGLVQLKIELESSELSGTSGDANSLITNKRTVNTNVLIEDGGIVVLGGLIRDSATRGEQRVPYLGRIPIIGELFKTRSRRRDKSNLMVFIRPKILRDGAATAYRHRRQVQLHAPAPEGSRLAAGRNAAADSRSTRIRSCRRFRRPPPRPRCCRRKHRAAGIQARRAEPPSRNHERCVVALRRRLKPRRPQRVGFAFAKRHGVLVRRVHEGIAECVYRPGAAAAGVRRSAALHGHSHPPGEGAGEKPSTPCSDRPTKPATTPWKPPKASRNPPTSRTSRRTCPNRPTCSRAKTMRPSSGSSTPS